MRTSAKGILSQFDSDLTLLTRIKKYDRLRSMTKHKWWHKTKTIAGFDGLPTIITCSLCSKLYLRDMEKNPNYISPHQKWDNIKTKRV